MSTLTKFQTSFICWLGCAQILCAGIIIARGISFLLALLCGLSGLAALKMVHANGRAIYYDDEGGRAVQSGAYILMQYTGLKDRNGKEIYEGDIVSFGEPAKNYQVLWNEVDAAFFIDKFLASTVILASQTASAVIGNVYETPELLEQES